MGPYRTSLVWSESAFKTELFEYGYVSRAPSTFRTGQVKQSNTFNYVWLLWHTYQNDTLVPEYQIHFWYRKYLILFLVHYNVT